MPLLNKKEDSSPQAVPSAEQQSSAKEKKSLSEIQVPNWLAAVLIVGLVVVVLLFFFLKNRTGQAQNGTSFASEPSSDATQVEVLPQRVRSYTGSDVKNPFQSEALGNVQLTGIISNSAGKATVILQTDQASYIVNEGDNLPDSSWMVSQVGENYVTLSLDGNEKVIWMNGLDSEQAASSGVTGSKTQSTETSGGAK